MRFVFSSALFLVVFSHGLSAQDSEVRQTPAAGTQVEQSFRTADGADVEYLLYLPEKYGAETPQKFPLVLFLHGRGESYGALSLVAKWGPPMMAARGDQLPYILVSPQCPKSEQWKEQTQQKRLTELLEFVIKTYNPDQDRLYLTGLSMGGYGSWRMAADQPQRFAAVAPVCGGGDPADADKLKDLPIWAFHGTRDRAVPYQRSVEMVEAIKQAAGDKIRFTSLEHIGHNCWSAAYASPELYSWMLGLAREK